MSAVSETLTRKLGPLPVWAWGVGAGVGFNVARWAIAKRRPPAPKEVASDGATAEGVGGTTATAPAVGGFTEDPFAYTPGSVGSYSIPSAYANYGGTVGTPAPGAAASGGAPQTVEEWRARAYERLVGTGQYQPLIVSDALTKWLAGQPITAAEEAVVSAAQRAVGYEVPGGTPAITRAGASQPTTPAQPPSVPQPIAQPVQRSLVNFGAEGGEGWAALVLTQQGQMDAGTLTWLRDGDEYASLKAAGLPIVTKLGEPAQAQYLATKRTQGEAPFTFSPTLRATWDSRRV